MTSPIPARLALPAFAALLLASCAQPAPQPAPQPATPPVQACTMIGCEDGLTVRAEGSPAGPYRIEIRAEGEETQVHECSSASECGEIFLIGFLPDEVTVEVVAEDGRRVSRTVRPEYEALQPNGPGCPPTCRQARVTVPWEE